MSLYLALALILLLASPAFAQTPSQTPEDRYDEARATAGGFLQEAARCGLMLRAEQRRSQALVDELTKLKTQPKPAAEPKPEAK